MFFRIARQNPEGRILAALYRYGAPGRASQLAALLAAERDEAAWRRRFMACLTGNGYREMPGEGGPWARPAGDAGGRTAEEIKSGVLAMLAGGKETE